MKIYNVQPNETCKNWIIDIKYNYTRTDTHIYRMFDHVRHILIFKYKITLNETWICAMLTQLRHTKTELLISNTIIHVLTHTSSYTMFDHVRHINFQTQKYT